MRVATDKLTAKYKNCMKTKLVIIPPCIHYAKYFGVNVLLSLLTSKPRMAILYINFNR